MFKKQPVDTREMELLNDGPFLTRKYWTMLKMPTGQALQLTYFSESSVTKNVCFVTSTPGGLL